MEINHQELVDKSNFGKLKFQESKSKLHVQISSSGDQMTAQELIKSKEIQSNKTLQEKVFHVHVEKIKDPVSFI
jgi:hypothetical protein